MVVVRLSKSANDDDPASRAPGVEMNWIGLTAGGALVAGGLLLLIGRRRAGMIAAASGTALALLDQQAMMSSLWKQLPGYIDGAQRLLGQVQNAVDEIASSREKLLG